MTERTDMYIALISFWICRNRSTTTSIYFHIYTVVSFIHYKRLISTPPLQEERTGQLQEEFLHATVLIDEVRVK